MSDTDPMTVEQLIENAIATYQTKGQKYGHTYWKFGRVMEELFPGGLEINNADDWTRISIINQIVGKLIRYTKNFHDPNTEELDDLGVYAFILEHIDDCIRHRNNRASGTGSSAAE